MTTPDNPYGTGSQPGSSDGNNYGSNFGTSGGSGYTSFDGGLGGYQTVDYQTGGINGGIAQKNSIAPWALGISIAALVTAIVGIGFFLAPVGLILGIIAAVKARKIVGPYRRMGMAITSIVLSVIVVIAGIALAVFISSVMSSVGPQIEECDARYTTQVEKQECMNKVFEEYFTP